MFEGGHEFFADGRLVTIFSAPNYLNMKNDSCLLNISRKVILVLAVKSPSELFFPAISGQTFDKYFPAKCIWCSNFAKPYEVLVVPASKNWKAVGFNLHTHRQKLLQMNFYINHNMYTSYFSWNAVSKYFDQLETMLDSTKEVSLAEFSCMCNLVNIESWYNFENTLESVFIYRNRQHTKCIRFYGCIGGLSHRCNTHKRRLKRTKFKKLV